MNDNSLKNLKPPVKGEVRNPKGKPKGTLSAKVIIRKWLESQESVRNPSTKKTEKATILDSMTLALIAKARKGDVAAFNALLDRTEGKPTQLIGGDNTTEPIQVQFLNAPGCDPIPDND